MRYQKHIFICTNQRKDGSRPCCGEERGMSLVQAFKKQVKNRGLHTIVRAQRTGCLDACELGPTVVVYPEGIFYGGVTLADVDTIMEEHVVGNRPVERLIIRTFPAKEPA